MRTYSHLNKSFSIILMALLISGGLSIGVKAQSRSMTLNRQVVDFGRIATLSYVPKTVEFVNRSDKKLAILLVEKTPDVKVQFERRFFDPGEAGMLAFSYEPRSTGSFEETVLIYTNLDNTPYPIKLSGNVVSIQECFPDPKNLLVRSVEVIDIYTKAPVPNAAVSLVHNNKFNTPHTLKVDKEGKAIAEMPIGLYHITAEATAYEQLVTEIYVPKSQPWIILEMTPQKTAPAIAPRPQIPEQTPKEHLAEEEVPDAIQGPAPTITSTELPEDKYAANNLIFLLDISTSMKSGNKFQLLQQSVNNLAMILRPIDNVSIISYSNEASIVLTGANGSNKEEILNTVQDLRPYGITRGVKGLNTAYELATQNYIKGGNNQIILMTDGEFSEKGLSDAYYQEMLTEYASRGISLSILGFGVNKEAIDRMKLMCRAGKGSFILVSSDEFVKEVLIDEIKTKSFMGE